MATTTPTRSTAKRPATTATSRRAKPRVSILQTRIDAASKRMIQEAADLRDLGVSDYVRQVLVAQARQEIAAMQPATLVLSAKGQEALWHALHQPVTLTTGQKRLGRLMQKAVA